MSPEPASTSVPETPAEAFRHDVTTTPPRPSFIETQFPVSRLSKESYKERDAKNGQTLTPLGKWWGRKPLVMVRAVILGLLMPASDDPKRDRDVFLALLTMDDEGLRRRKSKNIPLKRVYRLLSSEERPAWFEDGTDPDRPKLRKGTKAEARKHLQAIVFDRLGYDEKLKWCDRPEQIDGPSPASWRTINQHLGTSSSSLPDLVRELGRRRFGRVPRVGDAFCGGGSVPFEATRIGCEAFGADLSPMAALLTWAALNIIGGGEKVAERVRRAQQEVFDAVDWQITEWRIEHNDAGWRADAFLYCAETVCPECGWRVPLAPSWVVGRKPQTVALLVEKPAERRFDIDIRSGVDRHALEAAAGAGTVKQSRLECPHCDSSTSMGAIRGDWHGRSYGLRPWKNNDLAPRPGDVFHERLYCVRWRPPSLDTLLWTEQCGEEAPLPEWVNLEHAIEALVSLLTPHERREVAELRKRDWTAENHACDEARNEFEAYRDERRPRYEVAAAAQRLKRLTDIVDIRERRLKTLSNSLPKINYQPVDESDLAREAHALTLLRKRFADWQTRGHIPSWSIVRGDETTRLMRERGWTHWHHLFTPRQLLTLGLLSAEIASRSLDKETAVASVLGLSRCVDYNSKLCRWHTRTVGDKSEQTFSNQALNTLSNFGCRGVSALADSWLLKFRHASINGCSDVEPADVRSIDNPTELWITDPPYADAINYHELSEFFLAWYDKRLIELFPGWYADSKRALAVQGAEAIFRHSMVDCYRNLTDHMPDNGLQVVMFTHQDASVWADLTLILWAAGLRVTAAWTIATETESALKQGNYVQGTVLMVLRKQTSQETAFSDEVVPEVEADVERQLNSMFQIDDLDDPNFSDADYQLAAYAAALRVLTKYAAIEDIDIASQLARERRASVANPIEAIIEDAVRTASNFLVPKGLPDHLWRRIGPEEKLYLKGLEVESHGDYRAGVYQEFARGFGVRDYRFLLRTGKANETRLKTASEFQRRDLGETPFGRSLVRHALYAVWRTVEDDNTSGALTWLRTELSAYWSQREALTGILRYLAAIEIDHWHQDATAARLVAGAVENDHV